MDKKTQQIQGDQMLNMAEPEGGHDFGDGYPLKIMKVIKEVQSIPADQANKSPSDTKK